MFKIIAAMTASVIRPGEYEEKNMTDPALKKSFEIWVPYDFIDGLFKKYNITEICELRALSVTKSYRGKNLGSILMKKGIDLALQKGLKV